MNIKGQFVGLDVKDKSIDLMAGLKEKEGNIATAVKEAIDVLPETSGDDTRHSNVLIPYRQRRKRVAEPENSKVESVEKVEETVLNEKETIEKDGQVAVVAPSKVWIQVKRKPLYDFVKRAFDIVVSLICLTVGLPVYLIMILAIVIDDPGNPFFVQERVGLNGRTFRMVKLRTMYKDAEKRRSELLAQNEADGPIFKITNDPRVTRVGKFLRKTSLDETAQVINLLLNDMTIVGPRPLPTYEQDDCNEYQNQRLLVKPGLTCYTALDKHSEDDFDNWIELDMKYIRERGLLTDLKIIFKTVGVVFAHKNC